MKQTYFIEPLNEGQDMNYVEEVEGNEESRARARQIAAGLKQLMPSGDFQCRVYNANPCKTINPDGTIASLQ